MGGGIRENIAKVQKKIREAALRAGREPSRVTLLAVSKTVTTEKIEKAHQAGIAAFGESRIQEAKEKINKLAGNIRWHFIGHLQTNKAAAAVQLPFELIHSVDSRRIMKELDKYAGKEKKIQNVLIEVKLSPEAAKHGIPESGLEEMLSESESMKNIRIEGLMTIPPYHEEPERSRPFYKRLLELRTKMEEKGYGLPHLSMGMSHDFEVAVEEGATIVRIGTAIFGKRG